MKRVAKSASRAKKPAVAAASRALTVTKSAAKKASGGAGGIGGVKSRAARVLSRNPFRTALGALALGFVVAKLRTIF
jgi:hypothetical protein